MRIPPKTSLAGQSERCGPVGWAMPRLSQPAAPIGAAEGQACSHWLARCRSRSLRSRARGTIFHSAEGGRGGGFFASLRARRVAGGGPGRGGGGCCGRWGRRDGAEASLSPPRCSGRCFPVGARARRTGPAPLPTAAPASVPAPAPLLPAEAAAP